MERRIQRHSSRLSERAQASLDTGFAMGQRVRLPEGLLGRIIFVSESFSPGLTEYQVTLDSGMGGGTYLGSQLRPVPEAYGGGHQHPAYLPAGLAPPVASLDDFQAAEIHTAADDYPEMGTILHDRPDPGKLSQVVGSLQKTAHYKQDDPYDREDPDSHNYGWCHACKEHHGSDEEAEEHQGAWTDWRSTYKHLPPEMHRGFALQITPGVHDHVHDKAAPVAQRAEMLRDHLGSYYRNLGMHWTPDQSQAEHYTEVSAHGITGSYTSRDPSVTHVVVHAKKPKLRDIERDPYELAGAGVLGHDMHEDSEIPLKAGAPVRVRGISWRRDDEPEFTHHTFREGHDHTAAVGAPLPHSQLKMFDQPHENPACPECGYRRGDDYQEQAYHRIHQQKARGEYEPDSCEDCGEDKNFPEEHYQEHDNWLRSQDWYTDWNEETPKSTLHRGIGISLPDGLHEHVHDESRPVQERAHTLLSHVLRDQSEGSPRGGLGNYWSDDPDVSKMYAESATRRYARHNDQTPVMLHVHTPPMEHVETDPDELRQMGVYSYHLAGNREVPIQHQAPLKIKGISWAPPGHGRMKGVTTGTEHQTPDHLEEDPAWTHHEFGGEGIKAHAAATYTDGLDPREDDYNGDPEVAGVYWAHPAQQQMLHEEFGPQEQASIPQDEGIPPMVATTYPGGQKIDDHGDAPGHGTTPRAQNPASYDAESTEGEGDPKWSEADAPQYPGMSAEEIKKRNNGATIGMYPEGMSAGGGPGLEVGGIVASYRDEVSDRWHEYQNRYSPDVLHRGIHTELPSDLHSYVHDEGIPREHRAQALADHFSGQGLGMHWTPHINIAHRAINNAADSGAAWEHDEDPEYNIDDYMEDHGYNEGEEHEPEPTHTDVIFHGSTGARNRLRNPGQLEEHEIGWAHSRDEDEFPVKPGSPMRLHGISWKQHEPEYPNEPYEHHDFERPLRMTGGYVPSWMQREGRVPWTAENRSELYSWQQVPTTSHGDFVSSREFTDPHQHSLHAEMERGRLEHELNEEGLQAEADLVTGPRMWQMPGVHPVGPRDEEPERREREEEERGEGAEPSDDRETGGYRRFPEAGERERKEEEGHQDEDEDKGDEDEEDEDGEEEGGQEGIESEGAYEPYRPSWTSPEHEPDSHWDPEGDEPGIGSDLSSSWELLPSDVATGEQHAGAEPRHHVFHTLSSLHTARTEGEWEAHMRAEHGWQQVHTDRVRNRGERMSDVHYELHQLSPSLPHTHEGPEADAARRQQLHRQQLDERFGPAVPGNSLLMKRMTQPERGGEFARNPKGFLDSEEVYPREVADAAEGRYPLHMLSSLDDLKDAKPPAEDEDWESEDPQDQQDPQQAEQQAAGGPPPNAVSWVHDEFIFEPQAQGGAQPPGAPVPPVPPGAGTPDGGKLPAMSQGGTPSGNAPGGPDNQNPPDVSGQQPDNSPASRNGRPQPAPADQDNPPVPGQEPDNPAASSSPGKKKPFPRKAALQMFALAATDAGYRFEFTASWQSVVAKARAIRSSGGVSITAVRGQLVMGSVRGDHGTYEAAIQSWPGRPQSIASWTCTCPWAEHKQDLAAGWSGRPCSHTMALSYEARSRRMFGRELAPDPQRDPFTRAAAFGHQVLDHEGRARAAYEETRANSGGSAHPSWENQEEWVRDIWRGKRPASEPAHEEPYQGRHVRQMHPDWEASEDDTDYGYYPPGTWQPAARHAREALLAAFGQDDEHLWKLWNQHAREDFHPHEPDAEMHRTTDTRGRQYASGAELDEETAPWEETEEFRHQNLHHRMSVIVPAQLARQALLAAGEDPGDVAELCATAGIADVEARSHEAHMGDDDLRLHVELHHKGGHGKVVWRSPGKMRANHDAIHAEVPPGQIGHQHSPWDQHFDPDIHGTYQNLGPDEAGGQPYYNPTTDIKGNTEPYPPEHRDLHVPRDWPMQTMSSAHAAVLAAANDPFGGVNTISHPPSKPYGATEPPDPDTNPASHGFLDAPDPENWGEINDMSATQTSNITSQEASLHQAHTFWHQKSPSYWDDIGAAHPSLYGDPEVHGEKAHGADGEGIGWAANQLANDRPADPDAENSGAWDLAFHHEYVDPRHIDYARTGDGLADPRVRHAYQGYKGANPDVVPPLVLVHRHGVYQVADGHHRAEGAALAHRPVVPAYVAYSEHEDEPFSGHDGEPPAKGPFHGAEPHPGVAANRDFFRHQATQDEARDWNWTPEQRDAWERQAFSAQPTGPERQDSFPYEGNTGGPYDQEAPADPEGIQMGGALEELHEEPEPALDPDGLTGIQQAGGGDAPANHQENPATLSSWGARVPAPAADALAGSHIPPAPAYPLDGASTGGGPGMSPHDEDLSPEDTSIQTMGNQQWSGGGADSDEVTVPAGQQQGQSQTEQEIVASFQRSAAARGIMAGAGGGATMADGEIAAAARQFLTKTADVLPDAEAQELIREGAGSRARNLDLLDLKGTHYEDQDEDLKRRGVSLDDFDDDVLVM